MVEQMQKTGPGFIKLLSILLTETPTFNSSKTQATFDLRAIHVEGMPGMPEMLFVKSGDKWYTELQR
jgi:hypothetical protein